jgi:hypothetical protein
MACLCERNAPTSSGGSVKRLSSSQAGSTAT